MRALIAALLLAGTPSGAPAAEGGDKTAICMPLAVASWEAVVAVYDDLLAAKPKYQAAKRNPSDYLLKLIDGIPDASICALMLELRGPEGIKAAAVEAFKKDLATGKYPRIFD